MAEAYQDVGRRSPVSGWRNTDMNARASLFAGCVWTIVTASAASAQSMSPPAAGTVEKITVHGKALEGNLEGDSPDRAVMVYLPPGYNASPDRRYPVVYLLHGFTDNTENWWVDPKHFVNVPRAMDAALARGTAKEMILVMPDAYTRYFGSMYSSGPTTGNWEAYVADELVAYVDAHYRTIADVRSRGLAGHSMGGYGTVRIGMKRPDVFSALYSMSACCLAPVRVPDAEQGRRAEQVRTPDEVTSLDFMMKATFASAAAWSPNPRNAPLFLDLPTRDGQPRPDVIAKWTANAPLTSIDQYISNLRRLRAIAFDVGTKDGLAFGSKALDEVLASYDLPHVYETYDGDHVDGIERRLETKVFVFFSERLQF
jgi:enterochelin esterase-like enzyme